MKVLFASGYSPFEPGSGPGNGLFHLSQALVSLGCDVHILVPQSNFTANLGNVRVHYYTNPVEGKTLSRSWTLFSLFSVYQINHLCKKYGIDVVNGRSPTTFAYSVMRKGELPFVVSAHGTSFGEISSAYNAPLKQLNRFELLNASLIQPSAVCTTHLEYANADRVIAVSRAVANELHAYYRIDKKKITIIHNGVQDISGNGCETKNLLLSVGRMVWRKGFTYLINSMPNILKENPNAKLILVGEGPYKPKLLHLVKKLNLQNSVTFFNTLSKDKLFQLYARAQVYIQPSIYEPLCNTILEAMSSKKAVIASRVGGIPEIIANGKNGILIDAFDEKQLAVSVNALLCNKDYREELGRNAKATVTANFSWLSIAKKTLNVYESLCL
jgi:glycosyltransferase involved in cell wall biosynthesis